MFAAKQQWGFRGDHFVQATEQARAWTMFWQEQSPNSRCLDKACAETHRALLSHWSRFGERLRREAAVLDIACGGGAVGRSLISARPDLRVTGVDAAEVTTDDQPNLCILPGVEAESLPFADRTFDGAVSQFGFEYCDTEAAAKELARVVKPGAPISLIVHHAESAIVRGARMHSEALDALLDPATSRAFLLGNPTSLRKRLQLLEWYYRSDGAVKLAITWLMANVGATHDQRSRVWNGVAAAIEPDRLLSRALQASGVASAGIHQWLQPLRAVLELHQPSVIIVAGQPIAWRIGGSRRR